MKPLSSNLKLQLKKVAILGSLFLGLFFGSFWLVNLNLDFLKKPALKPEISMPAVNPDEIKKRLGSVEISMTDGSSLSYDAWTKVYGLDKTNNGLDADPDKSGLSNYLEYVYLIDPKKADQGSKGFTDKQDILAGFDPSAPKGVRPKVEITIDKIGAVAPMVWSLSDDDQKMLKDLENGVSHFVGTAAPGQIGNMIVSGHSSNYAWAKGGYNHVFEKLNNLEKGDIVKVKETFQNGRVIVFTYKVTDKFVTTPDDDRIFAESTVPTMTLTTCWPIGTNLKRAIIKTEIVK